MVRGPLFQHGYSPQFSGHGTFPLRYGWLKKAYDRVAETEGEKENRTLCWGDDAIARFGVGKNMVASMRHWANATGVIKETTTYTIKTTEFGQRLLSENEGLDPYMEHPATLWLIHWQLAACPKKTTWFWAFSHFPAITFERDDFVRRLRWLAKEQNWVRASVSTIKHDVACFIRTYVARTPSGKAGHDDILESPFTELGLIKAVGRSDTFRFVRGPKSTLGDGAFAYALTDFWTQHSPEAATLAFEAIAHAPGAPGRVFCLDENDVADRLATIGDATGSALQWSETAGLKQVIRNIDIEANTKFKWLPMDYVGAIRRKAA